MWSGVLSQRFEELNGLRVGHFAPRSSFGLVIVDSLEILSSRAAAAGCFAKIGLSSSSAGNRVRSSLPQRERSRACAAM